jgi:hypothetical protein
LYEMRIRAKATQVGLTHTHTLSALFVFALLSRWPTGEFQTTAAAARQEGAAEDFDHFV